MKEKVKNSFRNMLLAFSIVVCLASLARRRHLRSDIVKFRTEDGIGSNHFTTLTQISNCLFSTLYSFQTNIKFSLEWSVYQQLTTFTPRTSSMHFSYYTMMHMQYLSLKGLLERKWQITSMLQMWLCGQAIFQKYSILWPLQILQKLCARTLALDFKIIL